MGLTSLAQLEKYFPLQGERAHSLNFLKLQSQSKLNPNPIQSILCSSFFLCLKGQSELCGSYHSLVLLFFFPPSPRQLELFGSYYLLQSCFSFFVHLHGQTEPFGSCNILQSCSSFFCLHGQPEVFVTLQLISITSLQSFESGQALFLVIFCF